MIILYKLLINLCYILIMSSFSIVLSSAFCKDEYPQNNGCEFTNELNFPLNFDKEQWCVSMTEMIYEPDFWENIRESFSNVEINISDFQSHYLVINAYARMDLILLRPYHKWIKFPPNPQDNHKPITLQIVMFFVEDVAG